MRVGLGFDVHPFSGDADRRLVLGGVRIAGVPGLAGHSDADVVAHALADALLGAAALDDLGTIFPASDPRYSGADSMVLLRSCVSKARDAGWRLVNADVALVAEAPALAPWRPEMEARLSEAMGGPVRVKPKRAEGLGALGRAEGMAAWAVALLEEAGGPDPSRGRS